MDLPILTKQDFDEIRALTTTQLTPFPDEFSPDQRRSGIWATDARKIAGGRAAEVYLEKVGLKEREDLGANEAAQWGLKLQDVIGREVSNRLKVELKEADYQMTHPKHRWMKSHFDFITADGKTLVEVKNYNQMKRNLFDNRVMPLEDRAQCIHETAVHNVSRIILAVLFGGQELVLIDSQVTEEEKEELIKTEAELWAAIQAKSPPQPNSPESARLLWPTSDDTTLVANQPVEQACSQLRQIKDQIKRLEEQESKLAAAIQGTMQNAGTLLSIDGKVLATWHYARGSRRFDQENFKRQHPAMFEVFCTDTKGSRRFLVK